MNLNTNVIMLPQPVVVYDLDSERFFLKIGTFVTTNAELADNILSESRWDMNHAVYKGVCFAEYPINSEGEVLTDSDPARIFITVGRPGDNVSIISVALKEATYSGYKSGNMFSRKLAKSILELSKYKIGINLLEDNAEIKFSVFISHDEDMDDMVHCVSQGESDIYGGCLYETEEDPPVEKVAEDIINHINNVAPNISKGKLLIDFEPRSFNDLKLAYENLHDLVKNYRGFKSSDWEII